MEPVVSTARPPTPTTVAAALCAEHISVATLLAFTGLVILEGPAAGWMALAAGCGYVVLSLLVVAPLRRSQIYSLSDFVEWRLESRWVRRFVSFCVVLVGCVSVLALLVVAGQALAVLVGTPQWVGWLLLVVAALPIAVLGTLGSSTGFQALQFWGLLLVLGVALLILAVVLPAGVGAEPLSNAGTAETSASLLPSSTTGQYSLYLALTLGIVGFPQLAVRGSMIRDARQARRTVLLVVPLLALLLLVPFGYAALVRQTAENTSVPAESLLFTLPFALGPGWLATVVTVLVGAGISLALVAGVGSLLRVMGGALAQCVLGGGLGTLRIGAMLALKVPVVAIVAIPGLSELDLAVLVAMVFQVSAVTLAPVLLLGIWWPRLTDVGVAAGIITGGIGMVLSLAARSLHPDGLVGELASQPVLVLAPLVTMAMITVSLLTVHRLPSTVDAHLVRMHLPADGEGSTQTACRE